MEISNYLHSAKQIKVLKMIDHFNFALQIIKPKERRLCKYNFWKATIKS